VRRLFHAIDRVLNPRNVDPDMQFAIGRVFACRWLDDVRDIERLTASMAQTHNLKITGLQNNEGSVNSDGLGPSLIGNRAISKILRATMLEVHLLHQTVGSQVVPVFVGVVVVVVAAAAGVVIILAVVPLAFPYL